MVKFRVEIDKKACRGFGACVELCPLFFQLSDVNGKSGIKGAKKVMKGNEVVAETLELGKLQCVREAAETCPFNAIRILNVETEEIPPRFLLLIGFLFRPVSICRHGFCGLSYEFECLELSECCFKVSSSRSVHTL